MRNTSGKVLKNVSECGSVKVWGSWFEVFGWIYG